MFYFSDIITDIRKLLGDESPYRYAEEDLRQQSIIAVRYIHSKRPDLKISDDGLSARSTGSPFSYTVSQYLKNYENILGWDRITNPDIFLRKTDSDTITIYPTDADRTADTNALATLENADSVGAKRVVEANSSGWSGTAYVQQDMANSTDWDVEAKEAAYEIDDRYEEAVKYFVVSRSFLPDSEDTGDTNFQQKHWTLFLNEIKG